jgi:hypothetical protein
LNGNLSLLLLHLLLLQLLLLMLLLEALLKQVDDDWLLLIVSLVKGFLDQVGKASFSDLICLGRFVRWLGARWLVAIYLHCGTLRCDDCVLASDVLPDKLIL